MSDLTPADRAERIEAIWPTYFKAAGYNEDDDEEDRQFHVVDLLADVLHWCRENGGDPDAAIATAKMHFDAETED